MTIERLDSALSDIQLISSALGGVERAFETLMSRHLPRAKRLVSRRMRDRDDVLDVVQETRVAIWKALDTYDVRRPFDAWVTSIALNKCRDWGRRQAVRARLLSQLRDQSLWQEDALHGRSPEKIIAEQEGISALLRALAALPRQFRQPLELTVFGELSQSDAGRALQMTAKAVENRVRRARGRLADALMANA
jgi:RNA polymerase sigma factor CnrH